MTALRAFLLGSVALTVLPGAAWAEESDQREIVVTASPLGGEGAKAADSKTLETSGAVSVADQLARTAPGVSINSRRRAIVSLSATMNTQPKRSPSRSAIQQRWRS